MRLPRPRKAQAERRTATIGVRLSLAERAVLNAAAAAQGVTPAALLRAAVAPVATGAPGSARGVAVLEPSAIAALNRVGANLNQLARRANAGDLLQPGELPDALADLSRQLDRIEALVMAELEG